MASNREEHELGLNIHLTISDDFRELRRMLYRIEYLKKLIPDEYKDEAEEIHAEILDLARKTIDANGRRSKKTRKPPNAQSGTH